jgi:ABC-2 type transport system ATP-binding protein/sodium transport system ATP-binding protein
MTAATPDLVGTGPLVVVDHVTKRFGGNQQVLAVDDVSFGVLAGEVFGLLGPNGAGKTTTLRMILGLLAPDRGRCTVDGFDVAGQSDAVKSRIGCVTANDGLYAWLSVREILMFFADLYGLTRDEARQRVESLSELFEMTSYLDRRASTLSTGQKQRAVLARGLVHDPPVMLLDEPTRGLDVIGSQTVFEYIGHLRSNNKAIILSTHRLDEAERFCDRFGLLHEGRLRLEGSLDDLRRESGCQTLVEIFYQLTSDEARPAI